MSYSNAPDVVIPTYNSLATLIPQLDALAEQAVQHGVQVLVVDNGSTDGTTAALQLRYGDASWLRLIDGSGRAGAAYAKNLGVQLARTEFIAFCDADDLVAPNWLREITKALAESRLVVVPREYGLLNPASPSLPTKPLQLSRIWGMPSLGGGAMALAREDYLAIGGFDEDFSGSVDTEFSVRFHRRFGYEPVIADTCIHVRRPDRLKEQLRRQYLLSRSIPHIAKRHPSSENKQSVASAARKCVGTLKNAARLPSMSPRDRARWLVAAARTAGGISGSVSARRLCILNR